MQKRNGKQSVNRKNTHHKSNSRNRSSNSQRRSTTKKFQWNNPKLLFLGALLLVVVVSYFLIGWLLTAIMVLGIGVILGVARLLDKTKGKTKQRKILNVCFIVILSFAILGCLAVGGFFVYVVIQAPKFDVSRLEKKETTIYYDKDGQVITRLGTEMREKVSYDDLPQVLIDAIIATEDARFFQHNGFDAPRFLAASIGQAAGRSGAGGASTLSMQVVKNSFTTTEDEGLAGIIRKFTDIYLSIFKLEKNYTKEQIIEFYVNNHYLGESFYGVEQASQAYFGKSVKDLNLSEAAILAGMFKSPNAYRPDTMAENAENRRETVLYLMRRHGYITKEEEEIANSIPVSALANPTAQKSNEFQGYIDTVTAEVQKRYGANPYVVPMLVYTNMDRSKQQGINRVMNGEGFDWPDDVIQAGVSLMDVHSGKIIAVGAGRHKSGANTFNFATFDGVAYKRQPGSTAKPLFDYGPLMEFNNASTYGYYQNGGYYQFVDEPYSYTGGKSIQNWDGTFMGSMTLRTALSLSRNIPALKAFQQVDNSKIIQFVQSLGIEPEIENGKIHEAHALGAFNGVSAVDMTAAYAAFANGGYYYEPYTVNKVVFRDTDETIEYASEGKQVMSDSTAFMITSVLEDVSVGYIPGVTFAAKTGTTNYDDATMERNNMPYDAISDSWLIGYTPDLAMGLWYGYEEIDPNGVYISHNLPMSNQKNRLWVALGKEVFEKNNKQFSVPNSVVSVALESGTSPVMLASPSTPSDQIFYEYFKKGTEPTETSSQYQKLDTPSNFKASYDEKSDKVTLTWSKVNAAGAKDSYGPLGYNVYFNDQLLGFTEKTTYTISKPKNPYGVYKVIAVYKNYNGNQSAPASTVIKDPSETGSGSETKYSSSLKGNEKENITLSSGGSYTIPTGANAVTVLENNKDVTSQAEITCTVVDGNGTSFSGYTLTEADVGVYTITYTIKYKNYTNTLKQVLTINKA